MTDPTHRDCRQAVRVHRERVAEVTADRDRLADAIEAVHELHQPVPGTVARRDGAVVHIDACAGCRSDDPDDLPSVPWPCPTIRTLRAHMETR
ncbi:hypothetical protein ACWGNE_02240 [Streptomyces xiamenensis]